MCSSDLVEDLPPAKYNYGANVSNSLVSSGCIVNGTVDSSVLFKKIYIGNNAVVKNSIIMNKAKLCVYVDDEEKTVTIAEAGYDHDLRDVPPYLLEMVGEAGICLGELEEQLMVGNLIYGERTACNGQEEHGDE